MSLAEEWFADYLHSVQTAGRKKHKAINERLPQTRDRALQAERQYDAETAYLRRVIGGTIRSPRPETLAAIKRLRVAA